MATPPVSWATQILMAETPAPGRAAAAGEARPAAGAADFIPSASFAGAREGYIFRGVGDHGAGYYRDTGPPARDEPDDDDVDVRALDAARSEEDRRFLVELEFVQCLANPTYIHSLAQRGFLEKPAFVNYLEYLLYWKDAKYAKFLRYPHCLFFLEQLQNEQYRMRVHDPQFIQETEWQQHQHWVQNQPSSIGGPAQGSSATTAQQGR